MSLFYLLGVIVGIGLLFFFTYKTTKETNVSKWKNLPILVKHRLYLSEKWGSILGLTIGMLIFTISFTGWLITIKEEETQKVIETYNNLVNKAIVLLPNGKIANLYLNELKPKAIQSYLDRIVESAFIWGENCMFKGEEFPQRYFQIVDFCSRAGYPIRYNLFTKNGLKDYASYLQAIFILAKKGNFPYFVKEIGLNSKIQTKKVRTKDNLIQINFTYTATVPVEIVYVQEGKIYKGHSMYKLVFKGFLNPLEGDINNPFGIKIDELKGEIPKINP